MSGATKFEAVLERHHPDLPVYFLVPGQVAAAFGKQATFVVEAQVNGESVGRRSIKPWGDGRWFMELTKPQCGRLKIREGDRLAVEVALAAETPPELDAALTDAGLSQAWHRRTAAQRRAAAELVFEARKPATRDSRIARILAELKGASG